MARFRCVRLSADAGPLTSHGHNPELRGRHSPGIPDPGKPLLSIPLYDELFSRHSERVREFCEGMQKMRACLDWDCVWTCSIRVCDVEPEMLRLMKASGCYLIGYGFESYSETILKSIWGVSVGVDIYSVEAHN